MARIIVVEDESALREDIVLYLQSEGHEVAQLPSGRGLDDILADGADIVILDINLPGESGLDIAARLRRTSRLGIIMLTARRLEHDRLAGLDAGADMYLSKPVSFRELAAHVRALCRRMLTDGEIPAVAEVPGTPWLLKRTTWRLAPPTGPEIPLTKLELQFLACLADAPDSSVMRNELMQVIYGAALDSNSRALDAMVRRLRVKAEKTSGVALPLQAVYASGYAFTAPLRIVEPRQNAGMP